MIVQAMKKNKLYNKWRNMSPAAKASLALVFAKFVQRGLSMISGPIFTRIMPQAEYGVVSTFTSWQSVLYIIATLNMGSGIFNNGMLEFKEDRESFMASIMVLANLCTLTMCLLLALGYKWIINFLELPLILIVVMILYFFTTPAYNYWLGWQRFEYKYKSTTIVIIVSSFVSTLVAILVVLATPEKDKAIAKLLVTEGVQIALGIIFSCYIQIRAKCKIDTRYWKYALKYQLPLIPHYLSMYVLSSLDRIMISKMTSTSDTAIYNVAYTVASIMLIFWNAIDASYAPWIYQKLEIGKKKDIQKRGNQILFLFAGATLLSALFAPEIIKVLAPQSYYRGVYVIPSVAAGVFFTAVFSLYMRVELYYKDTKFAMYATCAAAVINICLNYIFIPIIGFYAAGYTTLISYMALAFAHWLNLRRLHASDAYDNKMIALLSIGTVIIAIAIMLLYNHSVVRYIAIVSILAVAISKRRIVIGTFRK